MIPFDIFFFNDTATTEIYTLSLHDALPISGQLQLEAGAEGQDRGLHGLFQPDPGQALSLDLHWQAACRMTPQDRKSTRLNSSHANISYAVFCLKKKNKYRITRFRRRAIQRR